VVSVENLPDGYKQLKGVSPAEDDIGPFYYRREDDGLRLGFRVAAKNCNGIGTAHGGVLMAFADYASTMLALSGVKENCATISFSADFAASARLGDWVTATGEVVRRTRSTSFVRGQLLLGDEPLLVFQTVLRRLPLPSEAGA
jgi:uncharacterized protein (TIGR00369 family)